MPRRKVLKDTEIDNQYAFPYDESLINRHYTFPRRDLLIVDQHRGDHNKMGFAVQLACLRFPGIIYSKRTKIPKKIIFFIADQLHLEPSLLDSYGKRPEILREHLLEIYKIYGFTSFTKSHHDYYVEQLSELAQHTDKAIMLANNLFADLRKRKIVLPAKSVVERICARALTKGTRAFYKKLTKPIGSNQITKIEELLNLHPNMPFSTLTWLQQPPSSINAKHMLRHIERLEIINDLSLPIELDKEVHQNRLRKLAREGIQMTSQHLRDLEPLRRHATLIAALLECRATIIDEIIDLNNRIIGVLFNKAKRKHHENFQRSGKEINHKVRLFCRIGRALVDAKDSGMDPYEAIETVIPWEEFTENISEAEKLAQPESFDFLKYINDWYNQIRRYEPAFLEIIEFKANPAVQDLYLGVEILRIMNRNNLKKVPDDAPLSFIRKRWKEYIFTEKGINRRFYEMCVLSELKNSLRSGDIWVTCSRQFKDFNDYLLSSNQYIHLKEQQKLPVSVETSCEKYVGQRLDLLEQELRKVDNMARDDALPDVVIDQKGLKISPITNSIPEGAEELIQEAYKLLPHLKITDLLIEVDNWTGFTRHFTHTKHEEPAPDRNLLLTAILSDAINLGLSKMAESCPGTTYARLSWMHAWYIRDETYTSALGELVNAQYHHPFSSHFGEGNTSSSDGQRYRAGGKGEAHSQVNPKYGSDPSVLFYTHISDQYAPFHTQVINSTIRDATYVLDGLLYHESDLKIEEHYTDTTGFTDHVFALMHLLGFRFAPRIRDLSDKRIYIPNSEENYPHINPMFGGKLKTDLIESNWDEILRLASSIKSGTVTASLILRKLGSYPRQNKLAVALRELGRIERTLFTLEWIQNVDLRRRVLIGLNKGEAKNALARAVFFNRLGELRDRSFENQRYRASGLNLVVAAIILWNTVYLERSIDFLKKKKGYPVDDDLLQYLSPLGWEHINLTGDYIWKQNKKLMKGRLRPLRTGKK